LPGQSRGHSERKPEDDIFEDSDTKDESRETRVQNFEIGKDLRDHRNRCDGHSDRQDDDHRKAIGVRPCQRGSDQPRSESESQDEWNAGTHHGQQTDLAPFFAGEELLCFGAGEKHQQQQAEPVHEIKYVCLMVGSLDDPAGCRNSSDYRRTEHNSGQNLADDLRLPQFGEEVAQELRCGQQQQKK
jgi:hypothetical protein